MQTNYPRDSAASDTRAIPPPANSQLPTELLAEVIRLVLPPVDLASTPVDVTLRSYMQTLYTLRLVMKRWHEIIDGTPKFWTFILSTLPSHVNETAMLRSNNAPLAIVYSTASWNQAKRFSPADFLRGIEHTRHRWFAYSGPIVREYLETQAPLLRHVSLDGRYDGFKFLDLLGGYSTSLRHVELSHLSIPWRMGLFTHLHVLKLRDTAPSGLTTGHLLDFLHASPRLELLELTAVDAAISNLAYSSGITLSHLRTIELWACEYEVAEAILSHIRAPSCIKFQVSLFLLNEPNPPTFWEDNLQHFRGQLRAIHEDVGLSEIILKGAGVLWRTPSGSAEDHRFRLDIECGTPYSCLQFIERTLHSNSGLSFHFRDPADISEALLETIAPMRFVTKVKIGGPMRREDTLRILRFLGEVCSTQPLLPSLPGLQELELTSVAWGAQDLTEMVHSRFVMLPWDTTERSLLSIAMSREAFSWAYVPPILDFVELSKIRSTNGIKSVRFSDLGDGKGMVGITWDEETSKPVWG